MKKNKLLILQGIPASGKTTFAKKIVHANPETWIRVSRDDIRDMLGKYWVPKREEVVTKIEHSSIQNGLCNGYNVIVDATNLNPYTIKSLKETAFAINCINDNSVEVEFKEFTIPLRTAIFRDLKRGIFGRKVGKKVIKRFYDKTYGKK